MIGKLIGKVVDKGGDIIRRHQEGKITLSEAEAELRKLGLSLEKSVIEGQTQLALADGQSSDSFRTRWRPAGCWMLGGFFGLILSILVVTLTLMAYGLLAVHDPVALENLLGLAKWVGGAFITAMGIREGGKAAGNR